MLSVMFQIAAAWIKHDQTLEPPKFCTPLCASYSVACHVMQAITGHLKVGQSYSVSVTLSTFKASSFFWGASFHILSPSHLTADPWVPQSGARDVAHCESWKPLATREKGWGDRVDTLSAVTCVFRRQRKRFQCRPFRKHWRASLGYYPLVN